MKYTEYRGYKCSIRKIWSDSGRVCLGIVGRVSDLTKVGLLTNGDTRDMQYMCIPAPDRIDAAPGYGEDLEMAVARANFGRRGGSTT